MFCVYTICNHVFAQHKFCLFSIFAQEIAFLDLNEVFSVKVTFAPTIPFDELRFGIKTGGITIKDYYGVTMLP